MAYETILYEVAGSGVATITLNRPDRLNSFSKQMAAELSDVWERARLDDAIHVLVMRAAGDRAFSTGVDVTERWSERDKINPFDRRDPSELLSPKAVKLWKPLIVAIHGMAAGGAFYWINDSDIAICSEDAQFFDPHITYGMISSCEPTGLIGRIPLGEVLRWVLMGNDERMSAQTALRIGLVSEVVPRERLWARAEEIATLIAKKPPVAVQGSVRAIWEALDLPRSAAMMNALKYTQLGNPIGTAQVDRASVPKSKWTLR
ncbi:MAG: paaG [Gammaproteobacteria bacterium]|jgi:enoyl-CoA hydratase/carnithine racemase|nr:paaG [Gammaproteobacteria bacterium]